VTRRQGNPLLTVKVDNVACLCNHIGRLENLCGIISGVMAHGNHNLFGSNPGQTNNQLLGKLDTWPEKSSKHERTARTSSEKPCIAR
jgi:hypothetical protein